MMISFALIAADASAARSILVFKHDEDKVTQIIDLYSVVLESFLLNVYLDSRTRQS